MHETLSKNMKQPYSIFCAYLVVLTVCCFEAPWAVKTAAKAQKRVTDLELSPLGGGVNFVNNSTAFFVGGHRAAELCLCRPGCMLCTFLVSGQICVVAFGKDRLEVGTPAEG